MHSEMVIFGDTFSGGFVISRIAARLMPQFAMGPQKCVVLGPIGELLCLFLFDVLPLRCVRIAIFISSMY